jgi:cytochrome c-type biogenesis protein CcmF
VLATFLLTILGTFMTRSGVFNSVHSFTQSAIGPTILVFLAVALVWSVALLARASTAHRGRLDREGFTREAMFLVNKSSSSSSSPSPCWSNRLPSAVEGAERRAE